jgi:hypothetical protein
MAVMAKGAPIVNIESKFWIEGLGFYMICLDLFFGATPSASPTVSYENGGTPITVLWAMPYFVHQRLITIFVKRAILATEIAPLTAFGTESTPPIS